MTKLRLLTTCLLLGYLPLPSFAQQNGPQQVLTGFYLMNLYDLSLDGHSFYADFYLWFKWKGGLDPTNFEFVNTVEKWAMTMVPFADTVATLADGWHYQGYRVEGRFFKPFDLSRFPLDRHELEIHIENSDHPQHEMVYLPDTSTATHFYRPEFFLAGWNIKGVGMGSKPHTYFTDFGNPATPDNPYSEMVISIKLARPVSYFFLKLLLPLTIVMLAALGALLFFPTYVDARISLPVGSLLTAVFLQQSYSDALPDVGYMVLMDKIYLLAFGIIAAVIMQLIITGNRLRDMGKKNAEFQRIEKCEKRLAILCLGVYILGGLLVVWVG